MAGMRPGRSREAFPLILFFLLTRLVPGQSTPNSPAPAFEAADVHVSAPGMEPSGRFLPDGRVEFNATTIFALIKFAWNIEEDRIRGGPSWLDTDRFDILAKPVRRVPAGVQRRMLQALLMDRFGLMVHTENKPMPVFILSGGNRKLHGVGRFGRPEMRAESRRPGDCLHHLQEYDHGGIGRTASGIRECVRHLSRGRQNRPHWRLRFHFELDLEGCPADYRRLFAFRRGQQAAGVADCRRQRTHAGADGRSRESPANR